MCITLVGTSAHDRVIAHVLSMRALTLCVCVQVGDTGGPDTDGVSVCSETTVLQERNSSIEVNRRP